MVSKIRYGLYFYYFISWGGGVGGRAYKANGQNSQTELPHSFLFAFQLLFEGVVGNGEQGDISLDDVAVSYVCNGMDKTTCSSYFGTALERCKGTGKWQGRFLDKHRVLNKSMEKVTAFSGCKVFDVHQVAHLVASRSHADFQVFQHFV